jgi:hypothetical protein
MWWADPYLDMDDNYRLARLGIPIFGSDFWDPHRKQNSDSVFESEDSGWIFFSNSAVEKSRNQNTDSKIQNSPPQKT